MDWWATTLPIARTGRSVLGTNLVQGMLFPSPYTSSYILFCRFSSDTEHLGLHDVPRLAYGWQLRGLANVRMDHIFRKHLNSIFKEEKGARRKAHQVARIKDHQAFQGTDSLTACSQRLPQTPLEEAESSSPQRRRAGSSPLLKL